MGEYWMPVNVTKMECINPHCFGNGLKFREWVTYDSSTIKKVRELMQGRWKGDTVVVASDYGNVQPLDPTADLPPDLPPDLYNTATDISDQVGGLHPYGNMQK